MPCYRGYLYEPRKGKNLKCAQPSKIGEQDFNPAREYKATPNQIKYPFCGDEYLPAENAPQKPTAPGLQPAPSRRTGGSTKGKLAKPGHVKGLGGYQFVGLKHERPERQLCVRGKALGWRPPTLAPEPGPDQPQMTSARAAVSEIVGSDSSDEESEEEENVETHPDRFNLHTSKVALNLSIQDLGNEFKRRRILKRLQLLEAERFDPDTKIDLDVGISSTEKGSTEGQTIRPCDSCRNSLDRLECSMPQNKRLSMARWRQKDVEALETAINQLQSLDSGDGDGRLSNDLIGNTKSVFGLQSPRKVSEDSKDSTESESGRCSNQADEEKKALHTSAVSLNLSVTNLGSEFKKQHILDKLLLLEAEKRSQQDDVTTDWETPDETGGMTIKFGGDDDNEDNDDDDDDNTKSTQLNVDMNRSCGTCDFEEEGSSLSRMWRRAQSKSQRGPATTLRSAVKGKSKRKSHDAKSGSVSLKDVA